MAGRPYINKMYAKKAKSFAWTIVIWNLSLIYALANFNATIGQLKNMINSPHDEFLPGSTPKENDKSILDICREFAACDFITRIIPFFAVINTNFVDIFRMKHFKGENS